jgi:hypothetical protein
MSKLSPYLLRMVIFLAIVGALAAALAPTLRSAFLAAPYLNGAILILLVFGILLVFRQTLRLAPDFAWMAAAGDNPAAITPGNKPSLLAPISRLFSDQKGEAALSPQAARSLLDGVGARLDEARELSRYFMALLIFLGLLGTFWGLLGTISSVGRIVGELDLSSSDTAAALSALQRGLSDPLSAMGTAFSSSLFGLAGSLILGFLDLQAGQAQNRFFVDLENWLLGVTKVGSVAPGGRIAVDEEVTQPVPFYLQALLEQTAENLDSLRRTIAQGETDRRMANEQLVTLTDKLSTLSDQIRSEQSLLVKLAEAQLAFKTYIDRIDGLMAKQGPSTAALDDASREHLRKIDLQLGRLVQETVTARDHVSGEIRAEIKLLSRTIAALAAADAPPQR